MRVISSKRDRLLGYEDWNKAWHVHGADGAEEYLPQCLYPAGHGVVLYCGRDGKIQLTDGTKKNLSRKQISDGLRLWLKSDVYHQQLILRFGGTDFGRPREEKPTM